MDFIGFAGGLMNLYGYVGNNGTNATDLSGLIGFIAEDIWFAYYRWALLQGAGIATAKDYADTLTRSDRLLGKITQQNLNQLNAELEEARLAAKARQARVGAELRRAREAKEAARARNNFIRIGRAVGGALLLEGIIALAGDDPPEGVPESACLVGEKVQLGVKIQTWKHGETTYVVEQGARGTTITVDSPEIRREFERAIAEMKALLPLIEQLMKDIEALQRDIGIMEKDRTRPQQLEDIKKALDANPNGGKWVPPAGK